MSIKNKIKNRIFFKKDKDFKDPHEFSKKYSNTGDFSQNTILADGVYLNMNTRKTKRNNNVLVIGGSGNGKTHSVIEPNLLQANCSYVVTDEDGILYKKYGHFLEQEGYKIKVFDLTDMSKSLHYNPFVYIRNEKDVVTMVDYLIKNTNRNAKCEDGGYFEKVEAALLTSLCFYLIEKCPKEERNFANVMKLLDTVEINENDPDAVSTLDILMDDLEKENPESMAVKKYKFFKMAAGKTAKGILISVTIRLQVFNFAESKKLTNDDTLDLGSLGDEKQVLFIVLPQADNSFNFFASMLISQLINILKDCAEKDGMIKPLKTHVRFLLDEFANIGAIPEFDCKIAVMRGYNISFTIVLRSLLQLKTMCKDEWEVIADCCDTFLFLGCQGKTTLEYVINRLKNKGIDVWKVDWLCSDYHGHGYMCYLADNDDCVVFVRGEQPICTKKYDPTKHPNFKYIANL